MGWGHKHPVASVRHATTAVCPAGLSERKMQTLCILRTLLCIGRLNEREKKEPFIPTLGSQIQADLCEFEVSEVYIVSPSLSSSSTLSLSQNNNKKKVVWQCSMIKISYIQERLELLLDLTAS